MVSVANSMIRPEGKRFVLLERQSRQAETLDGLLARRGRKKEFQLVKLDVQGAELAVLGGAGDMLKSNKVLMLEVPVAGALYQGAPNFAEYIAF